VNSQTQIVPFIPWLILGQSISVQEIDAIFHEIKSHPMTVKRFQAGVLHLINTASSPIIYTEAPLFRQQFRQTVNMS